jgi:lipopolysaccharide heptosyltransferase III
LRPAGRVVSSVAPMARLTVMVLVRDEAEGLARLLASVRGLADELLVVTAGTPGSAVADAAREAGARVLADLWHGEPDGRGRALHEALALAAGEHVLLLGPDTALDPELAAALRSELGRDGGPPLAGYRLRVRIPSASGRAARFGDARRDRGVRLFRRSAARVAGTPSAPFVTVDGPIGTLPGFIARRPPHGPEAAPAIEAAARAAYRAGERWRPWDALRGPAGFLRRYLLLLGLLDGGAGLRLALDGARADALAARWLRRLDREIGGARGRGPLATRVRDVGRRLVIALATALFPTPRAALPPAARARKVLVVRTDERVGNQLLTTPLLRALKLGLPTAELHLLAAARQSQVVATRHVDRVIPFEKRLAFRRPWRLVALLRALRSERYDAVVEAAHWSGFSLTASLLARVAAGGGAVVGHARGESPRFLSHPVAHDAGNANEVQAKLELLRPFGVLPRGLAPETELGQDPALAAAVLARCGVARPYAVLNPGARMADRRWPPTAHAAVARGLLARGLAVVVVWGPGEEALARGVAEGSGAAFAPPTSLPELASLLRGARLCVSNNSGPMHLAVAVGAPTVGVFLGRESPARWGHLLPAFAVAEPRDEGDAAAVLAACDRLLRSAA